MRCGAQGVNTVFGYPGGAIMPVYDALYDGGVNTAVPTRARCSNGGYRLCPVLPAKLAYVSPRLVQQPTLINRACGRTVNSIPVVAITGQVSALFIGTDAFQEVDA